MKNNTTNSNRSFYIKAILSVAAISILSTAILAFVSYPTQTHREIATQQTEIIEKSGGTFSLEAYENDEYIAASNTPEAKYSSVVYSAGTWVLFIGSVILVGLVYKYIRRHNISPTRRAIGATTAVFVAAAAIDRIPNSYIPQLFSGGPAITWNIGLILGSIGSLVLVAAGTFVIAFLFEKWYNKHYNFEV